MDNDVPGTDYCIGFSTCVTRTIEMTHALRTTAGSHERFLVIEVFGRYAGFTSLIPTMAGAANRCVIPEHQFDIERLCELLTEDRYSNPSKYSVVIVSEGATFNGSDMIFDKEEKDQFGHKKLGGVGDHVSEKLKELSPKFNKGPRINAINQRLGYLVRCGDPDAMDSIVPMAFGNLAMDLVLDGAEGRKIGLGPKRPLRQRATRYRNQREKDRRRREILQHRPPAPHIREVRRQAALHHDQRAVAHVGPVARVAVLRNPLRPWRGELRFYGTGCGDRTWSGEKARDFRQARAPWRGRLNVDTAPLPLSRSRARLDTRCARDTSS